jgi:hypothetical protein
MKHKAHLNTRKQTNNEMKTAVFWDITPPDFCNNRLSEEPSASIIRVKKSAKWER